MYVWERVGGTEAGGRGRPHGSGIWAETWRGTQETEKDTPQGARETARTLCGSTVRGTGAEAESCALGSTGC